MREIVSTAKVIAPYPYDLWPRLKIDFDDILEKLEAANVKTPFYDKDAIKIVISIKQSEGDCIYGHPMEYRIEEVGQ